MKYLTSLFASVVLIVSSAAMAAVPTTINYQGNLTDSSGTPITATPDMVFSLYTVSSGGSTIWTETQSSVNVTNGIFNVQLGSNTPISSSTLTQADLWLGINVGGDGEMSPREKLSSAPFAVKASTADSLAANGANCSAGQYPLGVDASGAVEGCTAVSGGGVTAVMSGGGVNLTVNQSKYVSINGNSSLSTYAENRSAVIPTTCTAKNLYVSNFHWNSGTGGSHVFTVMHGSTGVASDTALSCTVSNIGAINTVTKCSNTSSTVSVNAGDYLVIKIVTSGITGGEENGTGPGGSSIFWGFTCE